MQDQLVEWFGSTGGGRALIIALVILVVLVCWLILPRVWNAMVGGSGLRSIRNRQPRLAVMDVAAVDNRRRLVLIRRDNVEHLILIGGPSDLVVEQTIIKGVPVGTTAGRVPRPPQTFDVPPSVSERAAERTDDERPAPDRSGASADRRGSRASEAVSEAAATVRALRPTADPAPTPAPAMAEPKPAEARRPMARPISPLQSAPSHPAPMPSGSAQAAAAPAASVMAQTALTPAPVPPPAPMATPAVADAPAAPAKPYVPPAPSRPAARQEPIATPPIVAEPTVAAPEIREPVAVAPPPRETAAPASKEPAVPFDDLAARLDEALRLDIEQQPRPAAPAPARAPVAPASTSYPRPTRGPAAVPGPSVGSGPATSAPVPVAPVPVPPVVAAPPVATAEPVADGPEPGDLEPPAPRSPLASASTWFRPRANPTPAPARVEPTRLEPMSAPAAEPVSAGPERVRLEPEALGLKPVADMPADGPDFPKVEPDTLARTDGPVAAVLPAVEPPPVRADIGSTLADDLARILVEEPNAGSRRPEPTINFAEELAEPAPDAAPPVVVDKPAAKETARADDFTSLEDEMARLLDELAGDSGRSSRS